MGGFCGYGGSVWVMGEWAVGYWIVGVASFQSQGSFINFIKKTEVLLQESVP